MVIIYITIGDEITFMDRLYPIRGGTYMEKNEYEKIYIAMHPSRLEIMKRLAEKRSYASQLEKELEMNRKVITFHLSMLQRYGLVKGEFDLQNPPTGKPVAVKYFELTEEGRKILDRIMESRLA
jgi:DNA-binding transcriptional ArsR family regulator